MTGSPTRKYLAETDVDAFSCGPLDDDDVRNRTGDREVTGKRRGHRQYQPAFMRVREIDHERAEEHDGRHVADKVGECRDERNEDSGFMQIPSRDWSKQRGRQSCAFRSSHDDE